jgi:hypothetical protein
LTTGLPITETRHLSATVNSHGIAENRKGDCAVLNKDKTYEINSSHSLQLSAMRTSEYPITGYGSFECEDKTNIAPPSSTF